jgi:molybdenum cofactor synthesis domain-containing protein
MTGEPAIISSAAALLIGNELLNGKVEDRNLGPLARLLRSLGIRLQRSVIVPDDVTAIAREVAALSASYDVVFTSGGVGPTHDDVTLAALAQAFSAPLEIHPELEAMLRSVYGGACTATHLRLARAPRGAQLKGCPEVRWPTLVMRNVWVFPGVPELFRMKLATVRYHLRGSEPLHSVVLRLQLEETELTPELDAVVARFPEVEIGSYPQWSDPTCKTEITFDAVDAEQAEQARAALIQLLPGVLHS